MKTLLRIALAVLVTNFAFALPTLAEEAGKEQFDKGLVILAQGDLAGAQNAFAAAAKADPKNKTYREHFGLVRRARQVVSLLEREKDPVRWEKGAQSLRSFYHQFEAYGLACEIDAKRHAKSKTPAIVADYAESLLECGKNKETIELVSALPKAARTPHSVVRHAIALVRLGQREEGEAALGEIKADGVDGSDWRILRELASLRSLLEDPEGAANLLTKSFEMTPPSLLDANKAYTKKRTDLEFLRKQPVAEKVWATKSTVKESDCSTGSDCSTCPSRGGCGSKG